MGETRQYSQMRTRISGGRVSRAVMFDQRLGRLLYSMLSQLRQSSLYEGLMGDENGGLVMIMGWAWLLLFGSEKAIVLP